MATVCERLALGCDADELRRAFGLAEALEHTPRYNIAAGRSVPVFAYQGNELVHKTASWGLVFSWVDAPTVFKNKALHLPYPTALHNPYYRRLTLSRRCAVPLTGFDLLRAGPGAAQLVHIRREDGALFAAAGIYDVWGRPGEETLSFSLLTHPARPPCDAFAEVQPALLEPAAVAAWLRDAPGGEESFPFAPTLRADPASSPAPDEQASRRR